ncbi:MAG: hypothetical protein CM1200mP2_31110 [Planctomycetaceae bacterium]|nr:MAG: hypothetical protein CM1200mP2_31110 [Planctomycetaceae bacterium]
MALVTHDADQPETVEFGRGASQFDGVAAGQDTHPVESDVDFQDHPTTDTGLVTGGRQWLGLGEVVQGDDRVGGFTEPGDPLHLRSSDDHVGHQDVGDAAGGHHLGFGDLGTGDPDGTGRTLPVGDLRSLVTLLVRPPLLAPFGHERGHPRDVGLHHIEIDAQRGGVEIGWGVPGEGKVLILLAIRMKVVRENGQQRGPGHDSRPNTREESAGPSPELEKNPIGDG